MNSMYNAIFVIVDRGRAEEAMDAARKLVPGRNHSPFLVLAYTSTLL